MPRSTALPALALAIGLALTGCSQSSGRSAGSTPSDAPSSSSSAGPSAPATPETHSAPSAPPPAPAEEPRGATGAPVAPMPGAMPNQGFTYDEALAAWQGGMPYYDAFCIHYRPTTEGGRSQCEGIEAGTVDAVTGEYLGG